MNPISINPIRIIKRVNDSKWRVSLGCCVLLLLTVFLQGCVSGSDPALSRGTTGSVIMLAGVVQPPDKGAARNQIRWSNEIESSLRAQSRYDFITYTQAQRSLGDFHPLLLADYQDDELLSSESAAVLASPAFPARYVLFATLDGPHDSPKQVLKHSGRNSSGELVGDRSSITYSTGRNFLLTGALYDSFTGRRVWQRTLASEPVASRTYTEYHGSSFAGSVAAILANRFVNGKEKSRYPAAPSTTVSMQELVNELIFQMFNGPDQI